MAFGRGADAADCLPAGFVETLVETGKHDGAVAVGGDGAEEIAGRGDRAGGPGGDDRAAGAVEPGGGAADQVVAALRRVGPRSLRRDSPARRWRRSRGSRG